MRFTEFLRATVLLSAASATVLAAIAIAGAVNTGDDFVFPFAAALWTVAALFGGWTGRGARMSTSVGGLLASARVQPSLPQLDPARALLNRLWPLLVFTLGAGGVGVVLPQVPAVAAAFALVWALSLRRQSAAVAAIEERDGARFYLERTSPLKPIRLVRTPGFRTDLLNFNGASGRARGPRPRV